MEKWQDWVLGIILSLLPIVTASGVVPAITGTDGSRIIVGRYPAGIGLIPQEVENILAGEASPGVVQRCTDPVISGLKSWPRPTGQHLAGRVQQALVNCLEGEKSHTASISSTTATAVTSQAVKPSEESEKYGKNVMKVKIELLVKRGGSNQSRDPKSRVFGARGRKVVPRWSCPNQILKPRASRPERCRSHEDHLWCSTGPTEKQHGRHTMK